MEDCSFAAEFDQGLPLNSRILSNLNISLYDHTTEYIIVSAFLLHVNKGANIS